jgi:Flp pilus assembly protein TadD
MVWFDSGSDPIANAMGAQQSQRASVANAALSRGAAHLQTQEYDLAVRDFRFAAAYQPDSSDAQRLMGVAYSLMGKTDDAVAAYQRALKIDPSFDQARGELATLYLKAGRYSEAETELKRILGANASDPGALTSLGYAYMNTGRLEEAATRFEQAVRVTPRDATAHYNLGLVSRKLGRTDVAIRELQRAVELDSHSVFAYSELAYAYLDNGDTTHAQEQVGALFRLNTAESVPLAYEVIGAMLTPKIAYFDSTRSTFPVLRGPRTALADLDPALATPGGSVVMTVSFVFNQAMDPSSVQNIANWSITKAAGGTGGVYDNGVVLDSDKEVRLSRLPISVDYDPTTNTATLHIRLTQNATGDGVIDPSHWVFRFGGVSLSGAAMDPSGNEYDGFALVPY